MMMKKLISFAAVLCLLVVFFSCGGAKYEAEYATDYAAPRQVKIAGDAAMNTSGFSAEMSMNARAKVADTLPAAIPESAATNRKLVKTTHLSIRVDDLHNAAETISAMIQNFGGYSSSTQIEENSQTYNIRVPVDSYEAMINQTNELGKVSSRSDFAEDVTLQYYDIEGRLNMRQELLGTYRSYLSRAANIEEILSVEKKIAELQNEIDMYGQQFSILNNQIDYATIILTVYGTASGYTYEAPSILDRIKDLFGNYNDFLSGALIVIIQIVVYGIPILIAAALMFWILFGKIGLLRKLWNLVMRKKGE
jgi:hypothetical protein